VNRTLVFPQALRLQLESEARAAFPRECCGLIEGTRDLSGYEITFLHPVRNLSADADRFEIDPVEHFRHLKAARGRSADIIGCYHSHPNGRAEPSARDQAGAGEENFLWLIAGLTACQSSVAIVGFVFAKGRFQTLPLAG
jgi:proteasome lid subunit RPN8/RPN11